MGSFKHPKPRNRPTERPPLPPLPNGPKFTGGRASTIEQGAMMAVKFSKRNNDQLVYVVPTYAGFAVTHLSPPAVNNHLQIRGGNIKSYTYDIETGKPVIKDLKYSLR